MLFLCITFQWHNEGFDNHTTIYIEDFEIQKAKLEVRKCEKHEEKPIALGCKKCLSLACTACFSNPSDCNDGEFKPILAVLFG